MGVPMGKKTCETQWNVKSTLVPEDRGKTSHVHHLQKGSDAPN